MNGPQAIIRLSPTIGIAMAGWILYDYKTCHPMREIHGYDIKSSFVRFHNTFRPSVTLPSMTLEELTKYDGSKGGNKIEAAHGDFLLDARQGHLSFEGLNGCRHDANIVAQSCSRGGSDTD